MASELIQFQFFDDVTNETVVLQGVVDPSMFGESADSAVLDRNSTEAELKSQRGAVFYVVAVLVVYSFSIVFLVIMLSRSRSDQADIDKEVSRFAKGMENARKQAKEDEVKMTRLRWPGNFIGLRFTSRNATESVSDSQVLRDDEMLDEVKHVMTNARRARRTVMMSSSESDSDCSFTELAATTLSFDEADVSWKEHVDHAYYGETCDSNSRSANGVHNHDTHPYTDYRPWCPVEITIDEASSTHSSESEHARWTTV